MAKSGGKVTIKKYANRRLYDTESSSYITLDRLAAMIREGREFEVLDAKSGDDITHQVLTQIIVDEESRGSTMLPVNFLRQLIGLYGGSMQGAVPAYLDAAMDAFKSNQNAMRDALTANPLADLAKRNMAMFEDATAALRPKVKATEPAGTQAAGGASEIDKLRAELAALQAKVEKLVG
ncbi:polyhydroxyalkanoate synthesis repressor PhaR [Sphingomonas sp.]|jgi:polyhydroxyalkanoate synthesis repressor PhaR|uniref:polyhydroxyalkanoate synthesis repressor PhaR n=1 Tax=Sphingomonas sp. TaxID=28214 RepID=UPI0025DC84FE|nr:polyhydroxyalkanoate synthesis repressor PhaR [Sphingomonas sp.]